MFTGNKLFERNVLRELNLFLFVFTSTSFRGWIRHIDLRFLTVKEFKGEKLCLIQFILGQFLRSRRRNSLLLFRRGRIVESFCREKWFRKNSVSFRSTTPSEQGQEVEDVSCLDSREIPET